MWKGIRSRFIASQVWYKYFQTAQGCQRLPVSYCPSLGLVLAPFFPTVSQSVLPPSLFQALWFRDKQDFSQLRFSQCPALQPRPAIPSWNMADIDFFQACFSDGSIPSSACTWRASCLLPSPTSCLQCVITTRGGKMFGPTLRSRCGFLGRC